MSALDTLTDADLAAMRTLIDEIGQLVSAWRLVGASPGDAGPAWYALLAAYADWQRHDAARLARYNVDLADFARAEADLAAGRTTPLADLPGKLAEKARETGVES